MRYLHRSRAEEVGREDLHEPPLPSDPRQIGIWEVNVFNGSATSHLALTMNYPRFPIRIGGRVASPPPSRPGEFHPEPLTEPDLNLSVYPARATH
jgi:hypothetical protein